MDSYFMWNNYVDLSTTTLSADSTNANFPLANIQHIWKTKHHRNTDTSYWVKMDFGSAKTFQGFALAYHNFTADAIVKIQFNDTDDFTTPAVSLTLTWNADLIAKIFSEDYTYQYARFTCSDATNTDGVIKVGRLFLGPITTLSRNFDNSYQRVRIDPSSLTSSIGGQESASQRAQYREFSYQYSYISEADRVLIEDTIFAAVGIHTPFFFVHDSSLTNISSKTWYCKFAGPLSIQHILSDNIYALGIQLKEAQ